MQTNFAIKIIMISLILIGAFQSYGNIFPYESQSSDSTEKDIRPVTNTFATTMLVETQNNEVANKGQLQLIIHHRFSSMQNKFSDLFGVYGTSNIRLGINYGITKNLMVGIGLEKFNKIFQLHYKYAILKQTRSGSIPLSITYYGSSDIGTKSKDIYGINYKVTNRLSYFNQLIFARKFNKLFSAMIAPSYSHFNSVDTTWVHDKLGLSIGTRIKIHGDVSFITEYDQPFSVKALEDYKNVSKPNLSGGFEISTSTHAFQIFATTYKDIIMERNFVFNQDQFNKKGLVIGFNITVRF